MFVFLFLNLTSNNNANSFAQCLGSNKALLPLKSVGVQVPATKSNLYNAVLLIFNFAIAMVTAAKFILKIKPIIVLVAVNKSLKMTPNKLEFHSFSTCAAAAYPLDFA